MKARSLDSSAWIEITHNGSNAKKFAESISSTIPIIVSTISLYEIARYTQRVAGEDATEAILTFLRQYHVAPVTDEIAMLAASLGATHQLAIADALIYATARHHDATLWTQDIDFKGLPHVHYLPKPKAP
jgi:predicted nucleic acid-binding protein